MLRHRGHSPAVKRQAVEAYVAGAAPNALSKDDDICRHLIRVWVGTYEAGALDEETEAANTLHEPGAKIAALERMVGRQALEIELLGSGAVDRIPLFAEM